MLLYMALHNPADLELNLHRHKKTQISWCFVI